MATQKRNALGRGLDALLSMDDVKTEGSSSINEIELAKITVKPSPAVSLTKQHCRNWLIPLRKSVSSNLLPYANSRTMSIRSSRENVVIVHHKEQD